MKILNSEMTSLLDKLYNLRGEESVILVSMEKVGMKVDVKGIEDFSEVLSSNISGVIVSGVTASYPSIKYSTIPLFSE